MGLTSITNRVTYTGDGSSTVFSFPYYFFNTTDLQVYLFDTGSSIIYPQTLSTNYTISGNANSQGVYPSGANVVINSSPPASLQVIITRRPSEVQNYVLNQNGQINSLALVQQFDYITALVQALDERVSRSVVLPDGLGFINGSSFNPQLPASVSALTSGFQVLTVNSGATGFQLTTLPAFGSSILPIAEGGTGVSSFNVNQIVYGASTAQLGSLPGGTSGQVLISQGSGAPVWQNPPLSGSSFTGVLPLANGGTGNAGPWSLGAVVYSASSGILSQTAAIGAGFVLQSQGSSAPTWLQFSSVNTGSALVQRDANGNTLANNSLSTTTTTPATGATTFLTAGSARGQKFTGSSAQTVQLPIATNLVSGWIFEVNNNTNSNITVVNQGSSTISTLQPGTYADLICLDNSTVNGVWDVHFRLPSNVQIPQTGLNLATGSSVQGQLPIAYGGTGQSAQAPAFNALSPNTTQGDVSWYQGSSNVRLPVGAPNTVLSIAPTGSSLQWASVSGLNNLSVSTKTANYNATTSDDVILAASGCSVVNLYGASGNTGRVIRVKKTDSTSNPCVVAGSSATIDGSSVLLGLQNEEVTAVCDGTNWQIVARQYPQIGVRWSVASAVISATAATLTWRTLVEDPYSIMSGSTGLISINRSGRWRLEGNVVSSFTASAGAAVQLDITQNSSVFPSYSNLATPAGIGAMTNAVSDTFRCARGDNLRLIYLNANTSPSIIAGSVNSFISMTWVGE